MKAAIIQHEKSTPPGTTLEWLSRRAIPFQIFKMHEENKLPSIEDFDLLFICGGSMNVDQAEKISWLNAEKALLKKSIANNKCLVGLCLGAQLLAEALGASVRRHRVTEAGWQKVQFHSQGIFETGESLPVFQWHSYTFETPDGAQLLASNEACQNQAFVHGKNILAFQFHPESTEEWVRECAADPDLPTGPYCQSREDILKNLTLQKDLEKWYLHLLDQHLQRWQNSLLKK